MHLRDAPSLRALRGRSAAVVVCRDDADAWTQIEAAAGDLDAVLVLEPRPGPLSAAVGRPAVAVCDRWLDVTLAGADVTPQAALDELRFLLCRCEECPQAAHEPGMDAWTAPAPAVRS
jgi:hypothetical protein